MKLQLVHLNNIFLEFVETNVEIIVEFVEINVDFQYSRTRILKISISRGDDISHVS